MSRASTVHDDLNQLAQRVATGDLEAFRQIVDETSSHSFRLAARIVGSTADAEDVIQEAYLKAFRGLSDSGFDGRSSLRTWLYSVVTRAAIDALRRRKRSDRSTEAAPAPSDAGDSELEARIALAELASWLDDLPPEQRATLVLTSLEGFSNAEAAAMLDCTEGAVEQRLVRARATLRRRRGDHDDGP